MGRESRSCAIPWPRVRALTVPLAFLWNNGARGRIRTADTTIFSRVLYQLSYPGMGIGTRPIEARGARCPAP